MAVVLGTNAGFVSTAPTGDPLGGDTIIDDRRRAVKATSPATAIHITEIGWYSAIATEDVNFEVGIYTHDAGNDKPDVAVAISATNSKGAGTGWKVATGLSITISPSTVYWLAIQCDDTAPVDTEVDFSAAVGERYAWDNLKSSLEDPWGATNLVNDFLLAIYAVWDAAGPPPTLTGKEGGGSTVLHDFKRFPELTNGQMPEFYFNSPHKQITEDFRARVVKVTDGDTIRVAVDFRDFNFPVRLSNLAAPEKNEEGGKESQSWLEDQILGKEVDIVLSRQRVEKWGRLLADVLFKGSSMSEESINNGKGVSWKERTTNPIPDFKQELEAVWESQ